MADLSNINIVLKEKINTQDYEDINNLQNLCIERDNTILKLELDYKLGLKDKEVNALNHINEFLYYEKNILIGYIGICDFSGDAIEVNGMVHPDYRRKGIFNKLFSLVKDDWDKRTPKKMLLLSDNKAVSGLGFINSLGTKHAHSEYEMFLNNRKDVLELSNNIIFRKVTHLDLREIKRIDTVCFGSVFDNDDTLVLEKIDMDGLPTYLAEIDDRIIGKVRLEINNSVGGIYGLGVSPEYRGRGFGRDILIWSIKVLKEMGAREIMLQVSISNENALNLYTSTGFEITSQMDYFELI